MIRVLFHLPKQGRHVRQKINGCFSYSDEHGFHVFEGRLLTVQEFHEVSPKYLLSDSYAVRPLVKIIEMPDDEEATEPEEGAWVPPTKEEMQVLLDRLDGLDAENGKLRSAVTAFESAAVTEANKPAIEEPPAPAPEDKGPAEPSTATTTTMPETSETPKETPANSTAVVRELPDDEPAPAPAAEPPEAPKKPELTAAQKAAATRAANKAKAAEAKSAS